MINCSNCGKPLPWSKFNPHFKDKGLIYLPKGSRKLCCYQTECKCGSKADWNKDFVRDEWKSDNPNKKTVQLIN